MSDTQPEASQEPEGFYDRSAKWGFIKTSLATVATYAAASSLVSAIFFNLDEALPAFLVFGLILGSSMLAATLLLRGVFKWTVHPISMGLLMAMAQLWALGLTPFIELVTGIGIDLFTMTLPMALILFAIGYFQIRKGDTEKEWLPYFLRLYVGSMAVAVLCRIGDPRNFSPADFDQSAPLSFQIPILLLIAVPFVRKRFAGWGGWIIWPLIAIMIVSFSLLIDEDLTRLRSDDSLVLLVLGIVGVIAIGVLMRLLTWVAMSGEGWVRGLAAIVRDELTAGPLVHRLDYRLQWVLLDLLYLAIVAVLFGRVVTFSGSFDLSVLVEILSAFGYLYIGLFVLISLFLRLFLRRRFRMIHLLVAFIPALFVSAAIVSAIILPLFEASPKPSDLEFGLRFGISAILVFGLPAVFLFRLRKFVFSWPDLRVAVLFLVGAIIADILFLYFVGDDAAGAFSIGLEVGDIAALGIVIAGGAMFWRHRFEPSGFIVWPIAAFFGGWLLRILANSQSALSSFDDRIATGWGEILICCAFGAAMGELSIIAKRVWWDKDPEARIQFIRVRGGAQIVYAVWPILVLSFVLSSFAAFSNDISDEVSEIDREVQEFAVQAERLAAAVSTASRDLRNQLAILESQIETIRNRVGNEVNRIPRELQAIAADAAEAGSRVAAEAQRQGEEFVDDTIGAVKDGLADAFTLPPIDLGFFGELEFPDLGIGDAIGDMLSGLFSFDLGFDAMLEQFVTSMTQSITAEFAGPMEQAEQIAARMEGHLDYVTGSVRGQVDFVRRTANQLQTQAQAEYTEALARAKRILVQVVFIGYHLVVLFTMVILGVLAWLTWRALGGLFLMLGRIAGGWRMLTSGQEPMTMSQLEDALRNTQGT